MDTNNIASQLEEASLKSQALLERVAELTTQYEDKVADLRVLVTRLSTDLERHKIKVQELEERLLQDGPPEGETVGGEVVN